MSQDEKKRVLDSLQVGRALAACAVVLFHTAAIMALPKYWSANPVGVAFEQGSCGVFFFFVLSGYIITTAHRKDVGEPARLTRYFWNRFTRIYPLYWLVSLVPFFYLLYSSALSTNSMSQYLGAVTLLPVRGDVGLLAVAWTLFHEVVFYLFFAVLIVNRRCGIAVLVIWFAGCACFFVHPLDNAVLKTVFAPVNLLFLFGMAAAIDPRAFSARQADALLLGGLLLFSGVWGTFTFVYHEGPLRSLAYGVPSAMIVYGAVARELRFAVKLPRLGVWLGNASYSIYLVHFLVLSLLAKVFSRLHWIPTTLAFWLLAALGIAAGGLVHVLAERPLLQVVRSHNPARR